MNPTQPTQAKTRVKATTAYLYLQSVELGNLSKEAPQIELRDSNNKPLGRVFVGRIGIEFRSPHQKKRGVQKSWNQIIEWLAGTK